MNQHARLVIEKYDLPTFTFSQSAVEDLGSGGGFSGAQLWKLNGSASSLCLRRWPNSHPDRERLAWIHLVLAHAKHNECTFVAAPIRSLKDETFTTEDGSLWEVTPWMPGVADFNLNPSDVKLSNAMEALARFHLASAQVSLDFRQSTNLQARLSQLNHLPAKLEQIKASSFANQDTPTINLAELLANIEIADRIIAPTLRNQLPDFAAMTWPVQPVIRDVWHDHILFSRDDVTGLVDFGAMQMDHVSLDIARLLGSLRFTRDKQIDLSGRPSDDLSYWQAAITAYSQIRRLNEAEIALIPLLDASGILLGSMSWLNWILIENRSFENLEWVQARIEFLVRRLQQLIAAYQ